MFDAGINLARGGLRVAVTIAKGWFRTATKTFDIDPADVQRVIKWLDKTDPKKTHTIQDAAAWLKKHYDDQLAATRQLDALPGWRSTQTWSTDKNAKILRKNLGPRLEDCHEAHHIVQSTNKRAAASRKLLDDYNIDINDQMNGVSLTPQQHQRSGLEKRGAINSVRDRLAAAEARGTTWQEKRNNIIKELNKIGNEIKSGQFQFQE